MKGTWRLPACIRLTAYGKRFKGFHALYGDEMKGWRTGL